MPGRALAQWESVLAALWKCSRFTSFFYQAVTLVAEPGIPTLALTASAGRLALYYNPSFTESASFDQLVALLVHEMLHAVLNHEHRSRGDRDGALQNLAQDMVVNSYIDAHARTFFSRRGQYAWDVPVLALPGRLPRVPRRFHRDTGDDDPSWEKIYAWLASRKPSAARGAPGDGFDAGDLPTGGDDGSESPVFFMPPRPAGDHRETGELEGLAAMDGEGEPLPTGMHLFTGDRFARLRDADLNRVLHYGARDPRCGDEFAFRAIAALIGKTRAADTADWRRELKSIVDYTSQSGEWQYTYGRFNRRYFSSGIYSPGRVFKEKDLVTVAVDLSGSMVTRPESIEGAFGVIEDLLHKYRVYLLCLDEELYIPRAGERSFARGPRDGAPYRYRRGDWRLLSSGSGGTTLFAPLFNEYLRHHRETLLVITDGQIYDLDALKPYHPTVWVVPDGTDAPFAPPFGRVVTMPAGPAVRDEMPV